MPSLGECQELRVWATIGWAVAGQPIHAIVPQHGLTFAVRRCRHRRPGRQHRRRSRPLQREAVAELHGELGPGGMPVHRRGAPPALDAAQRQVDQLVAARSFGKCLRVRTARRAVLFRHTNRVCRVDRTGGSAPRRRRTAPRGPTPNASCARCPRTSGPRDPPRRRPARPPPRLPSAPSTPPPATCAPSTTRRAEARAGECRIRCTMQVCTTASGYTDSIASGNPFRPSTRELR